VGETKSGVSFAIAYQSWALCKYANMTSVNGSNKNFTFMLVEYLIQHKHSLKILFKSKHFPRRYRRKREWVFFETVYIQQFNR